MASRAISKNDHQSLKRALLEALRTGALVFLASLAQGRKQGPTAASTYASRKEQAPKRRARRRSNCQAEPAAPGEAARTNEALSKHRHDRRRRCPCRNSLRQARQPPPKRRCLQSVPPGANQKLSGRRNPRASSSPSTKSKRSPWRVGGLLAALLLAIRRGTPSRVGAACGCRRVGARTYRAEASSKRRRHLGCVPPEALRLGRRARRRRPRRRRPQRARVPEGGRAPEGGRRTGRQAWPCAGERSSEGPA